MGGNKERTSNKKKGPSGAGALGKSIIRDRFRKGAVARNNEGWIHHTTDVNDGPEWTKLQSVTEQGDLDAFLSTAELAGTEFTGERLHVKIIEEHTNTGMLSDERKEEIRQAEEDNRALLRIPRRPSWDAETTAEQLHQREKSSFLDWRRGLAELERNDNLTMTPFEKNLEVWRQLWRVIERSEIVIQIVDARNPLLFRCEDLETYVKEVDEKKENLLLINKSDMLTYEQRCAWAEYFHENGIQYAFWSANIECERVEEEAERERVEKEKQELLEMEKRKEEGEEDDDDDDEEEEEEEEEEEKSTEEIQEHKLKGDDDTNTGEDSEEEAKWSRESSAAAAVAAKEEAEEIDPNDPARIIGRKELMEIIYSLCPMMRDGGENGEGLSGEDKNNANRRKPNIGLVGYPNVGKSSTINALCMGNKVAVSATPGKTKHFQTIHLDENIILCDCPGLVLPSFVSTKAEMVCNGILPIDQLRDSIGPVTLVCQRIPRRVLELTYGISIIQPSEEEDQDRPPTAHELLSAYGYMRGYMTSHGSPDEPRSARYVLKDFVKGKLLYCNPPRGFAGAMKFNRENNQKVVMELEANFAARHKHTVAVHDSNITSGVLVDDNDVKLYAEGSKTVGNDNMLFNSKLGGSRHKPKYMNTVDQEFFHQNEVKAVTKGVHGVKDFRRVKHFAHQKVDSAAIEKSAQEVQDTAATGVEVMPMGKKHYKKNRKEKVRRAQKVGGYNL
eukprot:Nk52_evm23s2391 gene=Nk52_evmTU23s2391